MMKSYISSLGLTFSEFLVNKYREGEMHFFSSTKTLPFSIAALLWTSNLAMNNSGQEVLQYYVVHLQSVN